MVCKTCSSNSGISVIVPDPLWKSPASKVAFSSCNSSPAIGKVPRQILNPLYSGGLWLAVIATAASTDKSTVARYKTPVVVIPRSITSAPASVIPCKKASCNSGPDSRISRATAIDLAST